MSGMKRSFTMKVFSKPDSRHDESLRVFHCFYYGLKRSLIVFRFGRVAFRGGPTESTRIGSKKASIFAFELMLAVLFGRRLSVPRFPNRSVVFFGQSRNNEVQFRFLSRLFPDIAELNYAPDQNLAFVEPQYAKLTLHEKATAFSLMFACIPILLVSRWNKSSIGSMAVYFESFFRTLVAMNRLRKLPRLVVFSNDHWARYVGAFSVSRLMGADTLYIQHAEVSDRFPPLDFSISILMNERSALTYRKIGPPNGRVFVIRRNQEELRQIGEEISVGERVRIGIYLSYRVDLAAVNAAVAQLKKNTGVDAIRIYPHPRSDKSLHSALGLFQASGDEDPQIAIVGNSSVGVELLFRGIRVFQMSALSRAPKDYYRLVRDGLCPEVESDDLGREFWSSNFFDSAWFKKAERYLGQSAASRAGQISQLKAELLRMLD